MRRSDQQPRQQPRWNPFRERVPLPLPVYRELVDTLFGMRLPIVGLGLVFAGVAGLAAYEWQDRVFAGIALGALIVTAVRLLLLGAYARDPAKDAARLKQWELRYAIGNYAIAVLLAALNLQALTHHLPLLHLLTVSLVFGFGAGVVSRISVRPVICIVSLLLATVPTVVGLVAHALVPHAAPLHAELFAIEAVMVAMITGLSLHTVAHLYRSAVEHLVAQHDMAQLAKHDALTGLANRLLLRERFHDTSQDALRSGNRLAVHFIDLDGFKPVNDGYGHPAGDAVLQEVARRLQSALRAEDTAARLGGDEFVILQADVAHEDEAEMLARRILRRLGAPYEIEEATVHLSASLGIAMAPDLGFDLERLLACADAALYRSKLGGKARLSFCTQEDAANAELAA
ncbi:diguanylate cyclase domain-containing protein [Sphingomonas sp. MS122]|uniref:diguanylate cyclase domain-containing protein n=1 Tax=Sphingomonas sp. MS122 TaxID=3412683 RepID=UPI003C2D02DA